MMQTSFRHTTKGPLYSERDQDGVSLVRVTPPQCWWVEAGQGGRSGGAERPSFCIGSTLRALANERDDSNSDNTEGRGAPVAAGDHARRAAQGLLCAAIDPSIQRELMRWYDGTWELLRLLSTSAEARQLCETEDGGRLVWVCAQARMLLTSDWRRARALSLVRRMLRRRRREVVGALGFPATGASVRAIGRIVPANMSRQALRCLHTVLNDPVRRDRAAHLPRLPAVLLGALTSPHLKHCSDRLLCELAEDTLPEEASGDDVDTVYDLLNHSVEIGVSLGRSAPMFHSRRALTAYFEDVVSAWHRQVQLSDAPLPVPPDLRTDDERRWVRPLRSLSAWGAEGRAMRHCLGATTDQLARARAGTLACWAIDGDEPLTMAASKDDTGSWALFDLRGRFNSAPSPAMKAWAAHFVARMNSHDHQLALMNSSAVDGASQATTEGTDRP